MLILILPSYRGWEAESTLGTVVSVPTVPSVGSIRGPLAPQSGVLTNH